MEVSSNEMENEPGLAAFCPRYHQAVELIGRRWTGAVLRVLLAGRRRFHEVHEAIPGISDRLLTERLRELEAEDVVHRRVLAGPPLHVDYELTEKGRELEPVILGVAHWAEKWIPQTEEALPA
jgi:DNA-binding HxlR family transcriptional regulator